MKQVITAAVLAVAIALPVASALADGPRASSEGNWVGMTGSAVPSTQYVMPTPPAGYTVPPAAYASPQYQAYGHYVHGGKWRSDWTGAR